MGQVTVFIDYLLKKTEYIPESIYEKAKDCLYDYLAVAEAGAVVNQDRWKEYIKHLTDGKVPLLGYEIDTDGKTAALINGFNAQSLELDDGQRFAMIHLGGSIISALLSAKAENNITKDNFLKGIVVGYETACRLSISMQPSHKNLGFHAAGTCGTVGSALAVAFALNMNKQQMETVLAAAVGSAAGLLEMQEQESELKPYNTGRAAMDGLAAAYMGFTSFSGPDDILNGDRGFMKLFSTEINLEKMTENTDYYEIERTYIKPYAACRHCHSAIEAALNLHNQINIDDIHEIVVSTYKLAIKGHDHVSIAGISSAKLSIPYSVAVALILGKADISAFEKKYVENHEILNLTQKVKVIENPDFTTVSSKKRVANVAIFFKNGSSVTNMVEYAKGDPENPMSRQDIIDKAYSLIGELAYKIMNYVYT